MYSRKQRLILVRDAILENEECREELEFFKHPWKCFSDIDKYKCVDEFVQRFVNVFTSTLPIAPCNEEVAEAYIMLLNDWRF